MKSKSGQPITMNFDKQNAGGREYVNAYNQMFTATGTSGKNFGNDINITDFPNGYCYFCFNLEPFSQPGKYFNLIEKGFVKLTLTFKKPLPETVVLIVYKEHQNLFQVDAARNVITM